MMPQDFPSSGMKQATSLAAVHAFDAGTATALVRVERELRELWQRSVGPEVGRNGLPPQVVPALAALTDRVEALTLELGAVGRHDTRPLLASVPHTASTPGRREVGRRPIAARSPQQAPSTLTSPAQVSGLGAPHPALAAPTARR